METGVVGAADICGYGGKKRKCNKTTYPESAKIMDMVKWRLRNMLTRLRAAGIK